MYGYQGNDGSYEAAANGLTALGSSSLFTTVDDLGKWVTNFDDHAVGGTAVIERMRTRGVPNSGDTIGYGYGLSVGRYRGRPTASHTGSWGRGTRYRLFSRGPVLFRDPMINPVTGEETLFAFTGDPVSGTGWLDERHDGRQLISLEPIDLAPDEQASMTAAWLHSESATLKEALVAGLPNRH